MNQNSIRKLNKMITLNNKSVRINYSTKELNTFLVESKTEGKQDFYSIVLPKAVAEARMPGQDVKLSFTTSTKFVYNNEYGEKPFAKTLFIIPTFEYTINIWNGKEAVKQVVDGNTIVDIIKNYVPSAKIKEVEYKAKPTV